MMKSRCEIKVTGSTFEVWPQCPTPGIGKICKYVLHDAKHEARNSHEDRRTASVRPTGQSPKSGQWSAHNQL